MMDALHQGSHDHDHDHDADADADADDPLRWLQQLPSAQLASHSLPLYPNFALSLALSHRRRLERLQQRARRMDETPQQTAAAAAGAAPCR